MEKLEDSEMDDVGLTHAMEVSSEPEEDSQAATLHEGDSLVASGQVFYRSEKRRWEFWPIGTFVFGPFQSTPTTLRVTGKTDSVAIAQIEGCRGSTSHCYLIPQG